MNRDRDRNRNNSIPIAMAIPIPIPMAMALPIPKCKLTNEGCPIPIAIHFSALSPKSVMIRQFFVLTLGIGLPYSPGGTRRDVLFKDNPNLPALCFLLYAIAGYGTIPWAPKRISIPALSLQIMFQLRELQIRKKPGRWYDAFNSVCCRSGPDFSPLILTHWMQTRKDRKKGKKTCSFTPVIPFWDSCCS